MGGLTNDGTYGIGYDEEGRLGYATGPTEMGLSYDPLGRPWTTATSNGTNQFVFDGDQLIAEWSVDSGTYTRRYVFGPGIDEPVTGYEGSGTTTRRFLSADERGSIVSATDGSAAELEPSSPPCYGAPLPRVPRGPLALAFETMRRSFAAAGKHQGE